MLDAHDVHRELDARGWRRLLANLDALAEMCADHEVTAVLHPHVGTLIETPAEIDRVLGGSGIQLCLDPAERAPGAGPISDVRASLTLLRPLM